MIYILYHMPTTQSKIMFHYHIFKSLYPFLSPTPFPLVTTILLSVSMSFCLFFLFVHLFFSALYPTYEQNHMVLSVFCPTYFSRSIYVVSKAVFHLFLWLNSIRLHASTTSSLSNLLLKETSIYFHVLATMKNAAMYIRVRMSLQ